MWVALSSQGNPTLLPRSSAYLPLPISIALSGPNWCHMAIASFLAFGISFIMSLMQLTLFTSRKAKEA
jgi:hypothetical protein